MRRMTVAALAGGLTLGTIAGLGAQARDGGGEVLPALLTEVRGLRAAIEQMAAGGARVQLALGRLQLQEQRVNTAIHRLEETRSLLTAARAQAADFEEQVDRNERMLKQMAQSGVPPVGQANIEKDIAAQIEEARRMVARQNGDIQRLMADEAALANEVATTQAEWTRLNQQLDELERNLAPARAGR